MTRETESTANTFLHNRAMDSNQGFYETQKDAREESDPLSATDPLSAKSFLISVGVVMAVLSLVWWFK